MEENKLPTEESAIPDLRVDDNQETTELTGQLEDDTEIIKLAAELAEQKDKYLRLFAEFDNFKRRTDKERIE